MNTKIKITTLLTKCNKTIYFLPQGGSTGFTGKETSSEHEEVTIY